MDKLSDIIADLEPIPKPEQNKKFKVTLAGRDFPPTEYAGVLNLSKKYIQDILGIRPGPGGDSDKSKYQWDFYINGKPISIYDWKGSHSVACTPDGRELLKEVFLGFYEPNA